MAWTRDRDGGRLTAAVDEVSYCYRCRTEKPTREFYRDSYRSSGLANICRDCTRIKNRQYYYSSNGAKKQRKKAEKRHGNTVRRRFGLSEASYRKLRKLTKGACWCCGEVETLTNRRSGRVLSLSFDHDHQTGKFRGLLCNTCNLMLAKNVTIRRLRGGVQYLIRTKAQRRAAAG